VGISKAQLRTEARSDRSFKDKKTSWHHILNSVEFESAKTIASYLSYGDEPTTIDLNQEIIRSGKTLYLPRLLKDNDLEWVIWDGKGESLIKKAKHFEPKASAAINPEIDLVIVPTLCADRTGTRLGQGGGSYDRALPKLKAWRIGLIYAGELSNTEIPNESHDAKLDAVATPDLIVRFN
jgi:5-formyltetrahydrofolate cyclo-ligase